MPTTQAIVQRQTALTRAQTIVPYLTPDEVRQLADVAALGVTRNFGTLEREPTLY